MADESKFKFISPGIFLNEIDRSQIPALPDAIGPVIVGRAQRGPAFAPTKANSFSELTNIFGLPVPGNQQPVDTWREGAQTAPLYALYAAQAYLAAGVAPVTFVRLLGLDDANAVSSVTTLAEAGWQVSTVSNPSSAAATAVHGEASLPVQGMNRIFDFIHSLRLPLSIRFPWNLIIQILFGMSLAQILNLANSNSSASWALLKTLILKNAIGSENRLKEQLKKRFLIGLAPMASQ